jgi:hypothetical protein
MMASGYFFARDNPVRLLIVVLSGKLALERARLSAAPIINFKASGTAGGRALSKLIETVEIFRQPAG